MYSGYERHSNRHGAGHSHQRFPWSRAFSIRVSLADNHLYRASGIPRRVQQHIFLTNESVPRLSWFSAVTHLAALTHLRCFYANHFNMCVWRLVLVFCVVIMLLAAMVVGVPSKGTLLNPAGHSSIKLHYAICYWDSESGLTSKPETIFAAIETSLSAWFLVFGFASRVPKMNRRVSKWWFLYRRKTRESLRRFASGDGVWLCQVLGPKVFGLMIASPLIACRIFGRTYLELFTSFFAEVSGGQRTVRRNFGIY